MTKVFISYSRKDKTFAGRFTESLERCKLETWIDWDDIPPTADWMDQIHKGIQQADAFLVLLSPDSVTSKSCRQEVDHAIQNGKRLIPIMVRKVHSTDVHPALAKVNWIYACESADFDSAVNKTLSAIRTDLAWAESHRRLQVRALEWEKRKDRSLLLRGKDLHEAEEQLASAGHMDPQPTNLQRRYILESRRGESRTRNLLLMISAVVMVALAILSAFAIDQRNTAVVKENSRATAQWNAENQEKIAVANQHTAWTAQAEAEKAQAEAENERRIALSNGLSSSALVLLEKKEISLALLLGVQANNIFETARSRNALYTLLKQNEYMLSALSIPETVTETFPSFRTNATSDLLLAKIDVIRPDSFDAQYILWDMKSYQMLDDEIFPADSEISIDPGIRQLLPNNGGQPLDGMIEFDNMDQPYLGPLKNEVEDVILLPDGRRAVASYCKFSKHMASRCVQLGIFVFGKDAPFLAPQTIPTSESALNFMEIAYDQKNQLFALTDAGGGVMQVWQGQDGNLVLIDSFVAPGFSSLWDAAGLEFIPDRRLVAWGTDHKIILWDISRRTVAQEYPFDFYVYDFEISPDGTILAIWSESGTKVFLRDQAELRPVETGIDPAIAGAMGFDGETRIFAVGARTQIWVFDISSWSPLTNIKVTSTGDSDIESIFVSRDGTTIAAGMRPVQAGPIEKSYLIDIQTGLETGPFDYTRAPILSPENNQLASIGSYSNSGIALWNLDLGTWKERACQIANRNLTKAEWGQYMGKEPYQLTCPNDPAPD